MSSSTVEDGEVRARLRKTRADAGSVRLSERDAPALRLIGEQYAITVDQLARLIGRSHRTGRWLAEAAPRSPEPVVDRRCPRRCAACERRNPEASARQN